MVLQDVGGLMGLGLAILDQYYVLLNPFHYCRALNSNKYVMDDFFAKLGGVYGRLNLI